MADIQKIKMRSLTYNQREWLHQHGGRDEEDVMINADGVLFVEMVKGREKTIEVPLPQR